MSETGRWRLVAPLALTVLVTVLSLAVLNVLPEAFGGEPRGVVRYPSLEAIEAGYAPELARFVEERKRYLLYLE